MERRNVALALYKRLLRAAASLDQRRAAQFVQVQTNLHFRLHQRTTCPTRIDRQLVEAALSLQFIELACKRGPERNVLRNVVDIEWERLQLGRLRKLTKNRNQATVPLIENGYRRWITALRLFHDETGIVSTPVEVASVVRLDEFPADAPA